MTTTKTAVKWIPINEASFNEKRVKMLAKVRDAMTTANTLKAEWNALLITDARKQGKIPDGHTFRISHQTPWGQYAVAVALVPEKGAKTAKTTTGGMDLS